MAIVRYHDRGQLPFKMQPADEFRGYIRNVAVKVTERLVEQQEVDVWSDRPGQRDSLSFTSGDSLYGAVPKVRDTQ